MSDFGYPFFSFFLDLLIFQVCILFCLSFFKFCFMFRGFLLVVINHIVLMGAVDFNLMLGF
jgi:hypothetical protein